MLCFANVFYLFIFLWPPYSPALGRHVTIVTIGTPIVIFAGLTVFT